MRGLQKSKRVSWASGLNLCQVRLFLSEDSPSLVGLSSQDHLQAKRPLQSHPGGGGSDDTLPPGFEGTHASCQFKIDASQIPVVQWINPPKIVLDLTWQVVAGEESKEVEDQDKRELRVLEAIYPRPSSIPPNPSIAMDVEDSHSIDDGQTALIPITPIEDEDAAVDAVSDSQSLELPPGIPRGPMQLAGGVASDVAAASVALTNIIKSNEHGNVIDHEVLNSILNNPEMIEKLVRECGAINNIQYVHNQGSSSVAYSHPHIPINQGENIPSSVGLSTISYPPSSGGQVGPVTTQWLPRPSMSSVTVSSPPVEVPSTKDANYYKSLIQQHGGDRQETLPYSGNRQIHQPVTNQETAHISRSRDSKPKNTKPCIFFNSSRGCRNGANCAYRHDVSSQPRGGAVPRIPSSKRMKMDSEISG